MVIDRSALVAILIGESEQVAVIAAMLSDSTRIVGAPTLVETSMVILTRRGEPGLADLRAFLVRGQVEPIPFGADHLDLALDAFRRFGKGRHPAGHNFGDCFSYALARATGEPLLFKGNDFSLTDVRRAV